MYILQRVYAGDGTGRNGGFRNQRRARNRQLMRNKSRAREGEVAARTVSPRRSEPQPFFRGAVALLAFSVCTRSYLVMTWMVSRTRIPHLDCASDLER